QGDPVRRLADEVEVVAHHREVNQPEAEPVAGLPEAGLDPLVGRGGAEVRKSGQKTQCDLAGMVPAEARSGPVEDGLARSLGTARALAGTAPEGPLPVREAKLGLDRSSVNVSPSPW